MGTTDADSGLDIHTFKSSCKYQHSLFDTLVMDCPYTTLTRPTRPVHQAYRRVQRSLPPSRAARSPSYSTPALRDSTRRFDPPPLPLCFVQPGNLWLSYGYA
ncbi:hypothetical protein RSAG8_10758, partial [Rhizoctonia solani AG-8 WAC10335]